MADMLDRCVQLIVADDVTVERWSDDSLSCEIPVSNDRWKMHYSLEGGWIHMFAPLLSLKKNLSEEFLQKALRRNILQSVTRFAATGDSLCLRADYPVEGFQDEEFRLIHCRSVQELKKVVTDLNIPALPYGNEMP